MTEDSKPPAQERSDKSKSPRRSKSPKRLAEDSKPTAEERSRTSKSPNRSKSPKRSQEDRESKNRARRERDGTASTPGALSSSSSRDPGSRKAGEDRSSSRPGAVSSSRSEDRASRKAKEDQKSGSKPGAQSADSKSDKSRHKQGRSPSRDDDEKRKYRSSKKDKATVAGAQSVSSSDRDTREERKKAREASRTKPPPVASAAAPNEKEQNVAPVGDGGMEVQAELVQETDEREALRQEIRQELQAENAQSRDPAVGESGGTNQDQSGSSRNWKKIAAVIVVIVAIAAVGAYFGTKSSSKAVPATVATTSPTPATAVVVPGTPEPTLELTESPSTSPSAKLLFDVPSPEDCAAIASGEQVAGQENMKLMSLDVKMKMTLDTADETSLGTLLQDLQTRIQNVMIPQLTGCTDVEAAASQGSNVRGLLKGGRKSALRKLNTDPNRYAIGNGEVLVVTRLENESCGENCYVIVVPLELYLRSEDVRYIIVAQLVGNAFEATLEEILNVADAVIQGLIVDGVLGKDPTAQPSAAPTGHPSVSPSTLPSGLPSARPSGIPSVMPVMGQPTAMPVTGQPTKAPTPPPTAPPTLAATPPPTIAPTPPPTIGDSSSPTDAPVFQESCTGAEACSDRSGGSIGGGSCIGDWSCHGHVDVTVGSNSCLAPYSCTCISLNGFIFDDACQNSGDCCSAEGGPLNVPSTSCTPAGEQTCLGASSSSIGQRSCNASFRTCYRATATIGNDSCNNGGCQGVYGTIGDNSCNGDLACPWYEPMSIGSGSCNCEECCKCLQDQFVDSFSGLQVPDNSCNELAPPGVAVDFVNGGSGPYQYCCDGGTAAPVQPTSPPVPPPTLAPVAAPTEAPVACTSKCSGQDACSNTDITLVGCESCIGDWSCQENYNLNIGSGSCLGRDSCSIRSDGSIGDGSCTGDWSCHGHRGVTVGSNSCLDPYSCTCIGPNGSVSDNSCQNSGDCCSAEGGPANVPSTSCTPAGEQTCLGASSPSIGQRSCNTSFRTCYRATATIGNDSCNNGGCQGVHGNIGDNSCNGDLACPWYEPMSIGSGSCNCEECCKCLQDQYVDSGLQVPNNSCNELAPPGVAVDFVNGGSGPYQYCCDGGTAAPVEPPPPTPAPVACPSKCSGPDACSNANPAAIGCDSCIGEQTCLEASSPSIGQRSCNTNFRTCYRATATIGNDSCNNGGCQGVYGTIGDNSCNGDLACPWYEPMSIGNGSCNCEQCCKCLQDQSPQIPANSCNERAPTGVSVDFVSGGSGPYQYCCSVDDVY